MFGTMSDQLPCFYTLSHEAPRRLADADVDREADGHDPRNNSLGEPVVVTRFDAPRDWRELNYHVIKKRICRPRRIGFLSSASGRLL